PAEPKECAVQQPGDADDHSRRDTGRPRLGGGHAAPAVVATAIGDRTVVADPCGLCASAAASTISGASLRNPLKVIHRPSDSSPRKIGRSAIRDHTAIFSVMTRVCPI